jgi:hypothetical protein
MIGRHEGEASITRRLYEMIPLFVIYVILHFELRQTRKDTAGLVTMASVQLYIRSLASIITAYQEYSYLLKPWSFFDLITLIYKRVTYFH